VKKILVKANTKINTFAKALAARKNNEVVVCTYKDFKEYVETLKNAN
jgi:hypothetical protein